MKAKDIGLDEEGDIKIVNGDFKIEESDQMHIEHIVISNKGYWFEHPLVGVGIIDELKGGKSRQEIKQNIRRQLVADNFSVKKIAVKDNYEIDINAVRKI